MTSKRRTEILVKALELMSDENSDYFNGIFGSVEIACNDNTDYNLLWDWLENSIVYWSDHISILRLQEKQTLLCLAIAINDFKEATK